MDSFSALVTASDDGHDLFAEALPALASHRGLRPTPLAAMHTRMYWAKRFWTFLRSLTELKTVPPQRAALESKSCWKDWSMSWVM